MPRVNPTEENSCVMPIVVQCCGLIFLGCSIDSHGYTEYKSQLWGSKRQHRNQQYDTCLSQSAPIHFCARGGHGWRRYSWPYLTLFFPTHLKTVTRQALPIFAPHNCDKASFTHIGQQLPHLESSCPARQYKSPVICSKGEKRWHPPGPHTCFMHIQIRKSQANRRENGERRLPQNQHPIFSLQGQQSMFQFHVECVTV